MSDDHKKYVRGRALKHYRNVKKLTADKLADEATTRTPGRQISQQMIYAIEHGRMLLPPDVAERIAPVLDVSPGALLHPSNELADEWPEKELEPSAFQKGMIFARAEGLLHDTTQVHRDLKALETELGLELEPVDKRSRFAAQFDKVVLGLRRIVDSQFIRGGDVLSKEFWLLEQELPGTLEVMNTVRREVLQQYNDDGISNGDLVSSFQAAQRKLEVVANVLDYSIRASAQSLNDFRTRCGPAVDFSWEPFEATIASRITLVDLEQMQNKFVQLTEDFRRFTTPDQLDRIRLGEYSWEVCSLSQAMFFTVCSLAVPSIDFLSEVIETLATFVDVLDDQLSLNSDEVTQAEYRMRTASSHIKVRLRSIRELVAACPDISRGSKSPVA